MVKRTAIKRPSRTAIQKPFYISTTGHRKWEDPIQERLNMHDKLDILFAFLATAGISKSEVVMIHGCALGVDMWFGEYAMMEGIKFELYLPFKKSEQVFRGKFNKGQTAELTYQMKHAQKVVVVNKYFSTYGYQKRNMALVDNSDILASYFSRSRSGSGNCVRYAKLKGRHVLHLRKTTEAAVKKQIKYFVRRST